MSTWVSPLDDSHEFSISPYYMPFVLKKDPGAVFTFHFLCNIWMGPISQIVTLHQAVNGCQGQTVQLFEPIHMLQRRENVVNAVPESRGDMSNCFYLHQKLIIKEMTNNEMIPKALCYKNNQQSYSAFCYARNPSFKNIIVQFTLT